MQHAGTFRVIAVPAAGVSLFEDWRYERNPEATELKVATYNTLFNSESFDASKYKNIANLLGTRGSLDPLHHRIEERLDQAPFQWESDVIGMQEVIKEHDDNTPDDKYTAVMLDELKLRGPLDWTFAQGCGETWDCVVVGGCSDGPGMNPTFVNSNFFPTELPASAYFSSAAKKRADCYDRDGHPYYNECHLSKQGMGDGDTYNYATTAKVAEWRGGADDRLIAMFNVHMEASKGPKDFAPRVGEIRSLLKIMDRLLEADHLAFNRAAETDEHKPSPLHHQNRAIIMGDWNVCAHECGEHYWMVRMLREHFGYAVDVSMVLPDANGSLKQTMHTGDFGYGAGEVPIGYQHMTSDDPRPGPAWLACQVDPRPLGLQRVPVVGHRLAQQEVDGGQGGRAAVHDRARREWLGVRRSCLVVCVYERQKLRVTDEPVRPRRRDVAPRQLRDARSVGHAKGYVPHYSLGCDGSSHGGLSAGAPALHSDHRPMGARLRIWSR